MDVHYDWRRTPRCAPRGNSNRQAIALSQENEPAMIRGIHHIGVHTPNLDRLKSFYEQAFGFEMVGQEMNLKDLPLASLVIGVPNAVARVVMMKAPNCFIEMFQWSSPSGEVL